MPIIEDRGIHNDYRDKNLSLLTVRNDMADMEEVCGDNVRAAVSEDVINSIIPTAIYMSHTIGGSSSVLSKDIYFKFNNHEQPGS